MDTRFVEVAIGLVLVFAITSLLVSALSEVWNSLWKTRGNTLLLGLCSLLGDDNVTYGRVRRRLMKSQRPSPFTQALLQHPLMQSQVLGKMDNGNVPSYLSADVFVATLIAQLSDLYADGRRPDTPRQWLNAIDIGVRTSKDRDAAAAARQAFVVAPNAGLVQTLRTLTAGAAEDWPTYEKRLCAWYDAVMERVGGWYRRDTQLRLAAIGLGVAVLLNINPLVIGPRLWNDPMLRGVVAEAATQLVKARDQAASAAGAASSPDAAAAQVQVTLAQVLSAMQAAAPAAAASPAQRPASAAIGTAAARPASPQAIEVDQALSSLKQALFGAAADRRLHDVLETAGRVNDALSLLLDLGDQVRARRTARGAPGYPREVFDASIVIERHLDTLSKHLDTDGRAGHGGAKEKLQRLKSALLDERDALLPRRVYAVAARGTVACRVAADDDTGTACQALEDVQALARMGLPVGWSWANWPGCDGACQDRHRPKVDRPLAACPSGEGCDPYAAKRSAGSAARSITAAELKISYYDTLAKPPQPQAGSGKESWSAALSNPDVMAGLDVALLGWLIVAIASTLGAPFWFDLLGRFVKLRGSGGGAGSGTGGATPAPIPGDGRGTGAGGVLAPPPTPPAPAGTTPPPAADPRGAANPIERALGSEQIVRLQAALGLVGQDASGHFDGATRRKLANWQSSLGQEPTGELAPGQLELLLPPSPAPQPAPATASPSIRSRTPVRADGSVNVLSDADVRALYGNIGTIPDSSDPNLVKVVTPGLPGQAQWELVPFAHPLLDRHVQGLRVHRRALAHFHAVFDALKAQGLGDRITSCAGTFCARHIGRDLNRPLSRHTWGIAIDLNAPENPFGREPVPRGQPGSVVDLVDTFERFGFAWGGNFTTGKDGMHFELALRDPDAEPPQVT